MPKFYFIQYNIKLNIKINLFSNLLGTEYYNILFKLKCMYGCQISIGIYIQQKKNDEKNISQIIIKP